MTHQINIKYLLRCFAKDRYGYDVEEAEDYEDESDNVDAGWYALFHCAVIIIGQLQAQLIMYQRHESKLEVENKKLFSECAELTEEVLKLRQMTGRNSEK